MANPLLRTENGRHIRFKPAFDRRDPDPHKNYGVHGAEIHFELVEDGRAVVFVIYTNWMLPHIRPTHSNDLCQPTGAFVEFHMPAAHYESQKPNTDECAFTGGVCYTDATYTGAEPILEKLIAWGDEAVWVVLEEWMAEMRMDIAKVSSLRDGPTERSEP